MAIHPIQEDNSPTETLTRLQTTTDGVNQAGQPTRASSTVNLPDGTTNLPKATASEMTSATNTSSLTNRSTNVTSRNTPTGTNTPTAASVKLSMQAINVCGLKGKLINDVFRKKLSEFDISFLSETKLDDADIDDIQDTVANLGLKAIIKNRKCITTTSSGGLCILYKVNIEKYINHVLSNCNLVQWIKVSKDFIGTDKDVMFGNTYVPPVGSRYQHYTPFTDLQEEVLKYKNCYVCIAGDLNSRTGTDRDYVVMEDFVPVQLNYDSEAQIQLNSIKLLLHHNIRLSRSNVDKKTNAYGKLLLDFCQASNLFICNGRLNPDVIGKATTTDGSMIDYMLASPTILTKVESFFVHDFDAIFSDKHHRISWSINGPNQKHNHINEEKSRIITIKKTHRDMWTSANAVDFSNQLNIDQVNKIMDKLGNSNAEIDCILDDIQNLFKCTADTVLGHEFEYKIDVNRASKPMQLSKETRKIRNRFYKAKRLNNGSDERNNEVANSSKAYKKAVMKDKALHRKQLIQKLKNAKTTNPKFYWSVINQQTNKRKNNTNNTPSLDDFLNGFKALSGNDDQGEFNSDTGETDEARDEYNVDKELTDQMLNAEFTVEEIYLSVKELKSGKACGTDKISNEYIKSTYDKMKYVYVDLFNRVLNDGQIPEAWTIGMITPIYKNKGDKMDVNNYRGITILSCLGKLFTSVINARLNKYADEVNLINENQTGFRKKYSTTDHVFLLKNFIDIFVKNGNQKLYCAFVDYKKAFDTVWRSALWHKMTKSGITGKLHNVIVNMYNNIKSCVGLDGKLSDYFVSYTGVRQGENLSPFLFSLFVNDLEQFLLQHGCNPIKTAGFP